MKNLYKHIFHASAAMLLFTSISGCSSHQPAHNKVTDSAVMVTVANVNSSTSGQINLSGQLSSTQTAAISTRMMGYITAIRVKIGDKVAKGQLLVSISSQDIAAKQAQADASVMQAQAALENAKKDYERYKALFGQQSASQKELDNMTLQYHSAQAQLTAAKEMRKEADANMAYANLTAPFSGVITQKMADAGSLANPGAPLLMLERPGSYQVTAYATENQIALLQIGMPLTLNISSANKTLNTTISEISRSAENTGGQYLIKANIPANETNGLYSGSFVNVSIPVKAKGGTGDSQVWVPVSAIVHQDELDGIYTVSNDNRAMLRWLRLGKTQGARVEVLSGLSPNDAFISNADGRLYNGVLVKIK
ncbi:MAG: efflux RND transporter periplasmic adaptor subunit [Bacteroidetes bacterium]|jgi:RND family efflux transporter MFP subunit|nr:efflux RND transporter periplasmic adaptor subunit [Bacteroidota bacterium]